jgi:phosphoserine phosphatase
MSPSAERFRLVTFDLDGTLTRVHGWLPIAEAADRRTAYDASHARFFSRAIDEDAHLQDLLDLAVGLRLSEVEGILAATPKIDGIRATIARLHAAGRKAALLTHNPTYVCDWYAREFGFDGFAGTVGDWIVHGRVVRVEGIRANKLASLTELAERFSLDPSAIVHVGDGWADAAVFARVGAGIAFNTRLTEVEAAADVSVHADSLTAVLPVIDALARRPRRER